MRIAICEDDENERKNVIALIEKTLYQEKLVGKVFAYKSGEALLAAAEREPFQIYFLDILMPGLGGLSTAQAIRLQDKVAAIVFTTSSQDYYADGFAVDATHYLVKPYTQADMAEAMERCLRKVGENERYIELIINRRHCRIFLSQLCWAESHDKVCRLHLHSGERQSYLKLDALESLLDDPRFLRCHRSFLVNMNEVARMEKGVCFMNDGAEIPIKQAERTKLRTLYEDYLFDRVRGRWEK